MHKRHSKAHVRHCATLHYSLCAARARSMQQKVDLSISVNEYTLVLGQQSVLHVLANFCLEMTKIHIPFIVENGQLEFT